MPGDEYGLMEEENAPLTDFPGEQGALRKEEAAASEEERNVTQAETDMMETKMISPSVEGELTVEESAASEDRRDGPEGDSAMSTKLEKRTRIIRKGEISCPACGKINPLLNYFCSDCGTALREMKIKDHRHELMQASPPPGGSIPSGPTRLIRRTTTYLGRRIRHIQPVPSPLFPGRGREEGSEGKEGDTALIVGIAIVSLLAVAVIVLFILIIYYY